MTLFKKKEAEKRLPELPELPGMPTFPEIPREAKETRPEREEFGISAFPEPPRRVPIIPTIMPFEPIRRDIGEEYRDALSSFGIVKKKIQETSDILEKIRELKQKEDEEIERWNQELVALKEKINTIESKLFLRE
jgi:hypothetical protein